MIHIFQYTLTILALLYFVGYGITALFLPKHLQKDILWLMPWTGVALIAVYGALFSFAKIPMSVAAYIIMGLSGVSAIYALLMSRFERIPFFETLFLAVGFLACYGVNIIPLLKVGYPTVISLGNVDPITYTNVADFFVHRTVWQGDTIPPYSPYIWAVGDLVHYSYRWGSALLLSFFNEILAVKSYQTFSIMINLLFAMMFPILFVFAKQLTKRYLFLTGALIFLTFALNATLTYMLYHVFFAQFIFAGLYIYILILLFTHKNEEHVWTITGTEILLCILFSSVTTVYPEGLIFILMPFIFVTGLSYIYNRDVRSLLFFVKVCALMIAINPITFHTAIIQNIKIIFQTSRNTFIGWETIRHATPIEMLGFYNLYYYRPLPLIIRLALAFVFVAIWFIGFLVSKHKLWIGTLVGFFSVLLLHFIFNSPNFFLYHRNITYSVFLFSVLFSIGTAVFLSRFTKTYITIALIIFVAVTFRSFRRSFFQFYHHHAVVDTSLISLQELARNKDVPVPFYTSDVFLGEYNLWRRLWQDYMLTDTKIISSQNYPTEKYEKRLPEKKYILTEKAKMSHGDKSIKYDKKIWENEYYILGELARPTDAKSILPQ